MSRIGRMPITIPGGVDVNIADGVITVKGPKGELSQEISDLITIEIEDGTMHVGRVNDTKQAASLHGLTRTLINNMVVGVTAGYSKKLELVGVGYRAQMKGSDLELQIGYSHPVLIKAPEGISFACPSQTEIIVSGINKQQVGQVAAEIREYRGPEPYKGKGVKYAEERIIRKEGKKK